MAQSKKEIQSLLEAAGSQPRHRFGQNFMIDQNLVRLIAAAGDIRPGDTVIEVGPGTGTLTEELLALPAGKVIAVEIDRDLAAMLRDKFAGNDRFLLIEGDALETKHGLNPELLTACGLRRDGEVNRVMPNNVKLIANLPYNIASPLVIDLLLAGVVTLAFTVQKEVADRFRAAADSDDYGPLSVMAQLLGKVEVLRTLPPQAFWPQPKIDSALVKITRDDRLGDRARSFGAFLHGVFAYRRKTLRKALQQAGYDPTTATRAGLNDTERSERFSPERWLAMFNTIPRETPSTDSPSPPDPNTSAGVAK